jgi:hypothetical protein
MLNREDTTKRAPVSMQVPHNEVSALVIRHPLRMGVVAEAEAVLARTLTLISKQIGCLTKVAVTPSLIFRRIKIKVPGSEVHHGYRGKMVMRSFSMQLVKALKYLMTIHSIFLRQTPV